MLKIGLMQTSRTTVSDGNTAFSMGSGDMNVFATPAMIALMENAAMLCVAPYLVEGNTTVGSQISTTHVKPSSIGSIIEAIAELIEIDGRKLTFQVTAKDNGQIIGEGKHIRYIVDRERFLNKL